MTKAEIGLLIGFVFVIPFALYHSFNKGVLFGLAMLLANAFMNLYPSLLQQLNKRRIDRILERT